ncbi:hypothetical protein [Oscillatoria sp. FACHB-1406]|uniref:hypothetical protein n=1 Tax=Oscillatoria sp. FACHB-1406 TaxID=2692846 RepID=UPI0016820A8D|nr:hypothetical protein [Oscillatoria sp. FACHB-1406]MBD2579767.1 hypothetical protein [Oscillatoria sp. FACHB-1406]
MYSQPSTLVGWAAPTNQYFQFLGLLAIGQVGLVGWAAPTHQYFQFLGLLAIGQVALYKVNIKPCSAGKGRHLIDSFAND